MLLIAVGEGLKKVDKISDQKLLIKYPDVDWKGAKGLRDIISHNYFDMDEEIIFNVCKEKLVPLKNTLLGILADLQ